MPAPHPPPPLCSINSLGGSIVAVCFRPRSPHDCEFATHRFLRGKRYLILDRDTKYSDAFRSFLVHEGIKIIRLAPRSPNLNAFAERFVRSIKEECLSRMIFFGQASLRHAVKHFMTHYHAERNHQGLGNLLLQPISAPALLNRPIKQRQRLGGMLSYLEHTDDSKLGT